MNICGGLFSSYAKKQIIGLILGPGLFLLVLLFGSFEGLSEAGRAILASTLWIATWWITEAIPISATALLPTILFPLTGGLNIRLATEAYGHPMIFLFIGGFMIAMAIERWNLHKRIALNIIKRVGTSSSRIILGFMIATAFLSMWISNTATTLMMMPIGAAIVTQLSGFSMEERAGILKEAHFDKALMLAIAYSASIGGMATLIGTPTNVVFSGVAQQIYGIQVSFAQWMLFGLPVAIVLLVICWRYLVTIAFKLKGRRIPGSDAEIDKQLQDLGPITPEEKRVLFVFFFTAFAWITRSFILNKFIPGINDTIVAIFGALLLFLIPASKNTKTKLLDWETAVKLPWGIILLFGGGLSLAAGFTESGLAQWLGTQLNLLQGIALILLLGFIIASVNFLTEITSNVATASMILPILAALAAGIDVHPFGLMIAATVAASCAFMLPVATPPNAVVFGSGFLEMKDMVRTGIWMNLMSIIVLTLFVYFLLPVIWGFELSAVPEKLR